MEKNWFWVWIVQITEIKGVIGSKNSEIWENLLMIQACDACEAYDKAVDYGKTLEGDAEGSLTLDDLPAEVSFLGVLEMGLMHEGVGDMCEILFRIRRDSRKKMIEEIPDKEKLLASFKR